MKSDLFYYLNADHQPVGPMALAAIRRLVAAGVIDGGIQVCAEGEDAWRPLSDHLPSPATEFGPPRTPPPPMAYGNQAPPMAEYSTAAVQPDTSPEWFPLVSLFAGISSLILVLCSYSLVSLGVSVPAFVFGIRSLTRPQSEGRGFAAAGVVCGSLSVFLTLLATVSGGGGGDVAAIERTLHEIQDVGNQAGQRFPNDPVGQSKYLARHLRNIDTGACPPEFSLAYLDYVYAWETGVPYFEADHPTTWFLEGFLGGLANDYSGVGLTSHQARVAAENIRENFLALNKLAVAYGARLPEE